MRKSIVDYVAEYIGALPDDHPACQVFGRPLVFDVFDEEATHVNIFLYRFPIADDAVDADVFGETVVDIISSNRQGLCIVPLTGGYPDAHSGRTSPSFMLRCRHEHAGIAFRTVMELSIELQDNTKVFPQNGVIRSLRSQPGLVWASSRMYCYQADFRVLAAETII